MSAETLLQMAAGGALSSDDAARCGADGAWQPVGVVLESLRSGITATQATELEDGLTEPLAEIIVEVEPQPTEVTDVVAAIPARRGPLPAESLEEMTGSLNAATDGPIDEQPSLASDAYQAEPDGRFDELNAWKQARQERLARLLKIVAERQTAAARAAQAANVASTQTTKATASVPNNAVEQPASAVANDSPATPGSSTPSTPRPVVRRQEKWDETLARWRRSLPDWRFVVPLLLLPWLVWNFWPLSQGNIAETYRSMYSELRRRRDLPEDKTGMEQFVDRSQAQLDELLPKLKPRATAKNPDAQLLYWMGHDCLKPMLKSPRKRNTRHEDMLKKLLAQWDKSHGITPAMETPESNSEPLPPPSPSAKGLGFGSSAESSTPVGVELPPPSAKAKTPGEENQNLN